MQQQHNKRKQHESNAKDYNLFTDGSQCWHYSTSDSLAPSRNQIGLSSVDLLNMYWGSSAYESKPGNGQSSVMPDSVCRQEQGIVASSVVPPRPTGEYLMQETRQDASNPYSYIEPHFRNGARANTGQLSIYTDLPGGVVPDLSASSSLVLPEEPVYVNAKQYHGILRRRQLRAKAELENRVSRVRKPYLHESRHLHALRRARGCGGRFINTKKKANNQSNNASNEEENGFSVPSQLKTGCSSDSGVVEPSMSHDELSPQENKGVEFFQWKGFLSE